ncbi:MAG: thiamine pyrophosphate-dependent dehydrogenase E1 component subunit alpha [Deltaproteobacteria bacterium]|nr:MAG: thiamine pyrophosphate-dependent dehydrogenase E1 component subunit alpha [Deltaproteobacteria bacterium]
MRRVLSDDGTVLPGAKVPDISDDDLVALFDSMLLVRVMDERMMRLQRQGRLGFYMTSIGEEATHYAVYPLRPTDWVFPSYREQGAFFWRGYSIQNYIDQLYGNANDPVKGRQMPVHHSARWLNIVSISSPVGTQIPQAVGAGWAARIAGKDDVSMVFFGEGTSSTGEFHVGMNFAGVSKAPVVFVCRNNGWAISTSREKQTAAKTFASKAVGYGMPGIRVDGNDILAVIQVAQEAVDRARAGDGPTLIEACTYRRGAHSSSDDPSVYRDAREPEEWARRDPVNRFRNYLKERGLWTEQAERDILDKHNEAIAKVQRESDRTGPPPLESLFEDVYETIPWHLREQRDWLLSQPRVKSPHQH